SCKDPGPWAPEILQSQSCPPKAESRQQATVVHGRFAKPLQRDQSYRGEKRLQAFAEGCPRPLFLNHISSDRLAPTRPVEPACSRQALPAKGKEQDPPAAMIPSSHRRVCATKAWVRMPVPYQEQSRTIAGLVPSAFH